jgi:hypothetical protein
MIISFSIKHRRSSLDNEGDDWNPMCKEVILDIYNCDLTMIVKYNYLRGESMIENGLCSLWSGIRATYGINQGRVAFQIKVFNYMINRMEKFIFI